MISDLDFTEFCNFSVRLSVHTVCPSVLTELSEKAQATQNIKSWVTVNRLSNKPTRLGPA